MTKKYLVTGPTGSTGSKTVSFLLAAGVEVRAYVHRQDDRSAALSALGAEVVTGDLLDFEAVRSALEGTAGAYFVYPIKPGIHQATAYFAQAAKEAGISAIVNMSQISARREAKSHAAQDHWIAEQIFTGLVSLSPPCVLLYSRSGLCIGPIRSRPERCASRSELASMLPLPRRSGARHHQHSACTRSAQGQGVSAVR